MSTFFPTVNFGAQFLTNRVENIPTSTWIHNPNVTNLWWNIARIVVNNKTWKFYLKHQLFNYCESARKVCKNDFFHLMGHNHFVGSKLLENAIKYLEKNWRENYRHQNVCFRWVFFNPNRKLLGNCTKRTVRRYRIGKRNSDTLRQEAIPFATDS